MNTAAVISGNNIIKKYKGFELNIEELEIPKGFATALIGENGAGKTTLLNILGGIRMDYKGKVTYFNQYTCADQGDVKENIGYTGPGSYYMPHWSVDQVGDVSDILFDNFNKDEFVRLCQQLGITSMGKGKKAKKVSELSDGNKMKLMLAGVLARDTKFLLLDEPASPLDPLMRDTLCDMIHQYLEKGAGETSVLFSTHNIADMENVTDYAIIIEQGSIVEQGFVEDLKEKYVLVKGENEYAEKAEKYMYSFTKNNYGFEGIILADQVDKLAGMDVVMETPTLSQISVAVMKNYTKVCYTA